MILVTDATCFAGRAIVRRLVAGGRQVRCLLRPSRRALELPTGISFSTISASADDLPALRSSLQDVTAVVHLFGEDAPGSDRRIEVHPEETASLVLAMEETEVRRLIYLSRMGAEPASAFPLFRTRGEAESIVRNSGLAYTILQPAITHGPEDSFTNVLAMLAKIAPFAFPVPDVGMSRFQPLWIGDLAACVLATLDRSDLVGETLPLGGPEHLTLEIMVLEVLNALGLRRRTFNVRMPLVQGFSDVLDLVLPRNPVPGWMLQIAMLGNAGDLGAIPRCYGFEPARFVHRLDHLRDKRPWRRDLLRYVMQLR